MMEQTDVAGAADITLARLSRLQCHFRIRSIWLSMRTYGMEGGAREEEGQAAYSPVFRPKSQFSSFSALTPISQPMS